MKRRDVSSWHEAEVLTGRLRGRFRRVSGPVADMAKTALLTLSGHSLQHSSRYDRTVQENFPELAIGDTRVGATVLVASVVLV